MILKYEEVWKVNTVGELFGTLRVSFEQQRKTKLQQRVMV
jgi:hypothetical protein